MDDNNQKANDDNVLVFSAGNDIFCLDPQKDYPKKIADRMGIVEDLAVHNGTLLDSAGGTIRYTLTNQVLRNEWDHRIPRMAAVDDDLYCLVSSAFGTQLYTWNHSWASLLKSQKLDRASQLCAYEGLLLCSSADTIYKLDNLKKPTTLEKLAQCDKFILDMAVHDGKLHVASHNWLHTPLMGTRPTRIESAYPRICSHNGHLLITHQDKIIDQDGKHHYTHKQHPQYITSLVSVPRSALG